LQQIIFILLSKSGRNLMCDKQLWKWMLGIVVIFSLHNWSRWFTDASCVSFKLLIFIRKTILTLLVVMRGAISASNANTWWSKQLKVRMAKKSFDNSKGFF
jgi:hypothetical protein